MCDVDIDCIILIEKMYVDIFLKFGSGIVLTYVYKHLLVPRITYWCCSWGPCSQQHTGKCTSQRRLCTFLRWHMD